VFATLWASCSSPEGGGGAEILVVSQAATASDVVRVTLTISGAGMTDRVVELAKLGNAWRGTVTGIPAGTNRTFQANAYDAGDVLIFAGSVVADVSPTGVLQVMIVAQEIVSVTPQNHSPMLLGLVASTGAVAPLGTVHFKASVGDPDGNPINVNWTAPDGSFSAANALETDWTAPAAENTYAINIGLNDGNGGTASGQINITVSQAAATGKAKVQVSFNNAPVVNIGNVPPITVQPGGTINVTSTVNDPNGDPLTQSWTDNCGGTFATPSSLNSDWQAPATNAACKLTLTAADGKGGNASATLPIKVGPANPNNIAPQITFTYTSANGVTPAAGDIVVFEVQATDTDGPPPLTIQWTATGGSFDDASAWRTEWTAPADGNYTITGTVSDGRGDATQATFNITVCTPTTCAAQGKNCGTMSDGCGGTLDCGTCPSPWGCGVGGVANVCGLEPARLGYVTNVQSDSVSAIDTVTNTVFATIPVGSGPRRVAFTPNGQRAYVTNWSSSNVSVINTQTQAVITTIPTGSLPYGIAASPDGQAVYSTNRGDGTISIINTATNTVTATLPIGGGYAGDIAFNPAGTEVWFNGGCSDCITAWSYPANVQVGQIYNLGMTEGRIAFQPDGSHLYTNSSCGCCGALKKIDALAKAMSNSIPHNGSGEGVAVSPDGVVYAGTQGHCGGGGSQVKRFDDDTDALLGSTPGTAREAIALTPDNTRAYIVSGTTNSVVVLERTGHTVLTTIAVGVEPSDIGLSP
jgi:YVTN family beta-propeller protein